MQLFTADEFIENKIISVSRKTLSKPFPLHWHDFFELEIILSGNATQFINGNKYLMEQGFVYMLTPTDFHEITSTESTEIFNIMFHESFLSENFLNTLSDSFIEPIIKLSKSDFEKIKSICLLIETEFNCNDSYKNSIIKNLLETLLLLIFRRSLKKEISETHCRTQIQKAISYINLHFKDNPKLSDVAQAINYSPQYFSKKFKIETGTGYNEYLNKQKLTYAKLLLTSSKLSIAEICYASGFTSMSNFIRCFEQQEEISPSSYRTKEKH